MKDGKEGKHFFEREQNILLDIPHASQREHTLHQSEPSSTIVPIQSQRQERKNERQRIRSIFYFLFGIRFFLASTLSSIFPSHTQQGTFDHPNNSHMNTLRFKKVDISRSIRIKQLKYIVLFVCVFEMRVPIFGRCKTIRCVPSFAFVQKFPDSTISTYFHSQ